MAGFFRGLRRSQIPRGNIPPMTVPKRHQGAEAAEWLAVTARSSFAATRLVCGEPRRRLGPRFRNRREEFFALRKVASASERASGWAGSVRRRKSNGAARRSQVGSRLRSRFLPARSARSSAFHRSGRAVLVCPSRRNGAGKRHILKAVSVLLAPGASSSDPG